MSDETELVQVACNICTMPMMIPLPMEKDAREIADKMRAMCPPAHEACIDQRVADRAEKVQDTTDAERRAQWAKICPEEFREPFSINRVDSAIRETVRRNYAKIMAWRFESRRGIIAYGRTSRCKTRILFKLCEREFMAGRSVEYVRHPDFRETVSRLSFSDQVAARRYVRKFEQADIVLFDDLGKGRITEASEEAIESLINHRKMFRKPIFFSTNDGADSLQARLSADRGEPMIRRILDFCEDFDFGFTADAT